MQALKAVIKYTSSIKTLQALKAVIKYTSLSNKVRILTESSTIQHRATSKTSRIMTRKQTGTQTEKVSTIRRLWLVFFVKLGLWLVVHANDLLYVICGRFWQEPIVTSKFTEVLTLIIIVGCNLVLRITNICKWTK